MLESKIFRVEFGAGNSTIVMAICVAATRGPIDAAYQELLDKIAGRDARPEDEKLYEAMAVIKRHVDSVNLAPEQALCDKVVASIKSACERQGCKINHKHTIALALLSGTSIGLAHSWAVEQKLETDWETMPSGSTIQLGF